MQATEVMSHPIATCRPDDSLHRAAELMWNLDCGCVVVVDDDERPVGMLTDRDVCMAGWSRGRPLHDLEVRDAMAENVAVCRAGDALDSVHAALRAHQLHRLPVVDDDGQLLGIVCLADIVRAAQGSTAARRTAAAKQVLETYAAVSRPRSEPEPIRIVPDKPAATTTPSAAVKKPARKATPRRPGSKKTAGKKSRSRR